jgi:uncharacterized protein YggU (UPF0235/DUF167 family)
VLEVRASGDVVVVGARVRPGSRPAIRESDGGLVISVGAPPEKGKANEEACRALAEAVGVQRAAVTLRSGGKARRKVFEVRGLDPATVRDRLLAAAGRI